MPDLAGWLIVSVLMLVFGLLAVLVNRREDGVLTGMILCLAAVVLALSAFVRFAVLPSAGLVTLLLVLALGTVLMLVAAIMAAEKDPS